MRKKQSLFGYIAGSLALILTACLILSLTGVLPFFRKDTDRGNLYVVLGDSISAGYRLPGYEKDGVSPDLGFPAIFGKAIDAAEIRNLSVTGADTSDLLSLLQTETCRASVRDADVITLTIGSNNLLRPGIELLGEILGGRDPEEYLDRFRKGDYQGIFDEIKKVQDALSLPENKEKLLTGVTKLADEMAQIFDEIERLNDSAAIYVTNYYNPYAEMMMPYFGINFGAIVGEYIDDMNRQWQTLTESHPRFIPVDIRAVSDGKTNVLIDLEHSSFDIDPHPNEAGNRLIAEQLLDAYREKNGI